MMSEKHEHSCCADQAWHGAVTVEENVRVAEGTFRIRLLAPRIAARVVPGQFVMLRLANRNDPVLGRPLAVYDVVQDTQGNPTAIDIVYISVGKMTWRLAEAPVGAAMEIWGPLGNGFPTQPAEHLIMVAGGIGQTPFLMLAQEYLGRRTFGQPPRTCPKARKVTLCYGARSREYLAGVADFERAGVEVRVSTNDGSVGHRGLVTELIRPVVESSQSACRIVCCGPEPMMEATAEAARALDLSCQLSLETPMACGIGICFSCVTKIRDHRGGWDYRRTCVEGPVFDAQDVIF